MAERYRLSRAGLFNFWLYDEEILEFDHGRLLLRGPNGAGKSVTMQSLLPLVLDGDKRPVRLDPFGSRDRKIEFYLLGDDQSGVQDRIGYLWMEFARGEGSQASHVTVGIGLRATRGRSSVQFWGFAITDGRRVGKDLVLYDETLYLKEGQKYPLDHAKLAEVLGPGGQVVRSQEEYQALVNRLLFGYRDIGAYEDLLNLMIQVRSPKLSKEFKPSTMYETLYSALPPVGEEELASLANMLEDLDEHAAHLEETVQHRTHAERLHRAYDRYNRVVLFQRARAAHEALKAEDEAQDNVRGAEKEFDDLARGLGELEREMCEVKADADRTEAELEALEHSEAMGIQRELDGIQRQVEFLSGEEARAREALREAEQDIERREEGLRQVEDRRAECERRMASRREALERLADAAEFAGHSVYARPEVDAVYPDDVFERWFADVDLHAERLHNAISLGQEELRARERMSDAERAMGEAAKRRDAEEANLRTAESRLEQEVEAQEDAIFRWYQGLSAIPATDDMWREALYALREYPATTYDDVMRSFRKAHEEALLEAVQREHELRAAVEHRAEEKRALEQELAEWRDRRDPEPPRSEARAASRRRRQSAGGVGAPLYMACEFRDGVDPRTQAALERALEAAGLIDAWISPSPPAVEPGEEEVWIAPRPALWGYTLADFLRPTVPEGSGLMAVDIEDALRTIVIGDEAEAGQAAVAPDGRYRIGPLAGHTDEKPQAEWIGYEARRRTKLARIEALEAAIAAAEAEIARLAADIEETRRHRTQLDEEMRAFPPEDPLRRARDDVDRARLRLEEAVLSLRRQTEAYQEARANWRDREEAWLAERSAWARLSRLEDFVEAREQLQRYRDGLHDLRRFHAEYTHLSREAAQLAEDIERDRARADAERRRSVELRQERDRLRMSAEALREQLRALGVIDLYERQRELRARREALRKRREELERRRHAFDEKIGMAKERLEQAQRALQAKEAEAECALEALAREWALGLVDGMAEDLRQPSGRQALSRLAHIVHRELRGPYGSEHEGSARHRLMEELQVVRNVLVDYAIEGTYDEALGRTIVRSVRDRNRPLTPFALWQELVRMEEEQRLYIEERERELYEEIFMRSVGRAIRDKINRAEAWVRQMNRFMSQRDTSNGFALSLEWRPRPAQDEGEMSAERLVALLRKSPELMLPQEMDDMIRHFRTRIDYARQEAESGGSFREWIYQLLDYRQWFEFRLYYRKAGMASRRELTDSQFNVLSGGEKAMAMYIPLFAAVDARLSDAREDAPRIICLDEAFAGVDDDNVRDMFALIVSLDYDFIMTSQQLWGCYDTVPSLSIVEVHRPQDADVVTLIRFRWNGQVRILIAPDEAKEAVRLP
ncbi:TIGR02680 family protein [Alicyclobacillus acidocaldarius]|uniref:SMC domain protein n=1 Tax=Alicyclobacillus acidocaldarius subsp. acidocaldarius (strain ATCC 27009 / DSM 446 / BCRC 14685 / JCM 5260 / KCTC 1825 / NBRC 15652 / NCIMB 11725 / NRRL B-14509 / 104-IA) TaxID=521098 RepID=C8WTD7_ALIAD|nr:TIGR02680 family protein [Alicyclobacillus acidocaldarius]ACV57679.1 SMC domain protein [Alicyclobacillus acidocaldarius subsp. acidocaldarius DSM 446]